MFSLVVQIIEYKAAEICTGLDIGQLCAQIKLRLCKTLMHLPQAKILLIDEPVIAFYKQTFPIGLREIRYIRVFIATD